MEILENILYNVHVMATIENFNGKTIQMVCPMEETGNPSRVYLREMYGNEYTIIGYVTFNPSPEATALENVLQEEYIEIREDFQRQGYATLLYTTLCRLGFTILSADNCSEGTEALWHKLAYLSTTDKSMFSVYVLDLDTGEKRLYDGFNIPVNDIWHDQGEGLNEDGFDPIRLVLEKKSG